MKRFAIFAVLMLAIFFNTDATPASAMKLPPVHIAPVSTHYMVISPRTYPFTAYLSSPSMNNLCVEVLVQVAGVKGPIITHDSNQFLSVTLSNDQYSQNGVNYVICSLIPDHPFAGEEITSVENFYWRNLSTQFVGVTDIMP